MAEIIRLADASEIAQEAARRCAQIAREAVEQRGSFSIALSGGKTPQRLYELLASDPLRAEVPWEQTYLFWSDERRVGPNHEDSNYRLAKESLLDHVPAPADHVFRMLGEGLASSATRDYEDKLRRHFKLERGEWPAFDLILLGMGTDGHIASIFPGTRAASDLSNMVVCHEPPQLRKERITFTRPVLSHARNIMFLISGQDKAAALAATLQGPYLPSTYPAQGIQPDPNNRIVWLIDEAAGSLLARDSLSD